MRIGIGIDANGRSFRWRGPSTCQDSYAITGILSDEEHPRMIWDNSMAGSAFVPCKTLPLEKVWQGFGYLGSTSAADEMPDRFTAEPALEIVNAIVQLVPQTDLDQHVVLAIPNLLDEDGQDALLMAFNAKRLYDSLLLWRPVAIALTWISANEQMATQLLAGSKELVVWDFESGILEVTGLGWKESKGYACPVRRYPRLADHEDTLRFVSYEHAVSIASSMDSKESCHSIVAGPYGAVFQANLEENKCAPVLCQDANDPRRWRKAVFNLDSANKAFTKWKVTISSWARKHPDKHILIHGWPARFVTFEECNIEVVHGDSVARGCRIYAERLATGLPTYFDSLPEYGIWAKYTRPDGADDFGFRTVVQAAVVEGNHEWKAESHGDAQTKATLQSFSIAAHKNSLSLFVRNRMQFEDDETQKNEDPEAYKPNGIMVAKKLTMNLPANTRDPINLSMNIATRPAAGHIRIEISERESDAVVAEQALPCVAWFGDTGKAEFSWKTAQQESEHKGYLEAQEVVGRIMDRPEFREMAWLIIRKLKGESLGAQKLTAINNYINKIYRPTLHGEGTFDVSDATDSGIISRILEPWGLELNQPTRGLFGSRKEADSEVQHIADELASCITMSRFRNDYWKFMNYMFVYAPSLFKDQVWKIIKDRRLLRGISTWNIVIAVGRISDSPEDYEVFLKSAIDCDCDLPDRTYRQHFWWSFFRCLCYQRRTVEVSVSLIPQFLCSLGNACRTTPLSTKEKKYAAHAILFALRFRECDSSFLCAGDQMNALFSKLLQDGVLSHVEYPPSMLAGMNDMTEPGDNFSKYVWRFLNYQDTLKDREIGAGLATS